MSSEDEGHYYDSEAAARKAGSEFAAEQVSGMEPTDYAEGEEPNILAAYLNLRNILHTTDRAKDWASAIATAKNAGMDGIAYVNQFEDKGSTSYIVFDSNQIKSVDNVGAFDRGKEDIRYHLSKKEKARPETPLEAEKQLEEESKTAVRESMIPEDVKQAAEKLGIEGVVTGRSALRKRELTFRERLHRAYTKHIDDLHPIEQLMGEEIFRKSGNAIYGIGSRAMARITKGGEKINGVRPYKALKDIMDMVDASE